MATACAEENALKHRPYAQEAQKPKARFGGPFARMRAMTRFELNPIVIPLARTIGAYKYEK
jgi:hypothetical protein